MTTLQRSLAPLCSTALRRLDSPFPVVSLPGAPGLSTVFVIEDDPELRLLLCRSLQIARYHIIAVHNTTATLDYLVQYTVDVVIIDIDMPAPIGFALCEAIYHHSDAAIIVTSLYNSYEMKTRAKSCGAHAFLPKPIRLVELQRAVQVLTGKPSPTHD